MDLHRLRVVEFDTIVSEKEGEKNIIAELEECKQEECKGVSSDDIKYKTNEVSGEGRCVVGNTSPSGSAQQHFVKHKSKSEIFRIPTKSKLKKCNLKVNSSFEDLKQPAKNSTRLNQKKRNLNLFNRKSAVNLKGENTKKGGLKNNEEINVIFARETPSFVRYSRRRTKNEGPSKSHNLEISNDTFGFQKSNRAIDPYLYQMSCNYLNIDKFSFKNIKKGFRRKLKPAQQDRNSLFKHHAVRVLKSGVGSSRDYTDSSSIYYNISTHSRPHRSRRRRDKFRFEEDWESDHTSYIAKDQTVAVSPSSLQSITKCCCDARVGPSKSQLTTRPHHRSPHTQQDPSFSRQKLPRPRRHKPLPQHITPNPAKHRPHVVVCKKQCDKKKMGSPVKNQRKRVFSEILHNITAFHIKHRATGKSCIKYAFFGLLIVVWSPCLLAVILAWIVMCPVRITNMLASDEPKKTCPSINSFMNRIRKKGPGGEYQRIIRSKNYSYPKNRNFLGSVASWYTRAAGTVVNSFNAMISMFKIRNKSPPCAGSSFMTSSYPNPKKRYTLFYADKRGWMMKPTRRNYTRSCTSNRIVQSLRCEFKPKLWQKSKLSNQMVQTEKKPTSKNVNRRVDGFQSSKSNTSKQKSSPAGDAGCACTDVLASYSGNRMPSSKVSTARNIKPGSAILMPVPSRRLPIQQVNIPPTNFYRTSGIASSSAKYRTVKPKPKNFHSNKIGDSSQKKIAEYYLRHRKNGTLPFGVVFDCPCGKKHQLVTNREEVGTHRFGLAGKTLKMSTKYIPSNKENGPQVQSTKYRLGLNCPCKTMHALSTEGTDLINKTRLSTTHRHHTSHTRNRSVLADLSQSALTKQASTSPYKIDLKDKTQSISKCTLRQMLINLADKLQSKSKHTVSRKEIHLADKSQTMSNQAFLKKEIVLADKSQGMSKHFFTQNEIDLVDKSQSMLNNSFMEKRSNVANKTQIITSRSLSQNVSDSQNSSITTSSTKRRNALNCHCRDIPIPTECACKYKSSITKVLPKISLPSKRAIVCGCGTKKKPRTTGKAKVKNYNLQKHYASFDKVPQCACNYKPIQSNRETVSSKQPIPYKPAISCGYGTDKQLKTTATKHPATQKANNLNKMSPRIEKASICDCKETVSARQTASHRKVIDCGCKTGKQINTTDREIDCPCGTKHYPYNTDRERLGAQKTDLEIKTIKETSTITQKQSSRFKNESLCPCKPIKTKRETLPPKQSASYKGAIYCACGTKRQSRTTVIAHPSKHTKKAKTTQVPYVQRATKCICKHEPKKNLDKPVPNKKEIDCGCGNKQQKYALKKQDPRVKRSTQYEYDPSIAQEESIPPERLATYKKAIDFGYGTGTQPRTTYGEAPYTLTNKTQTETLKKIYQNVNGSQETFNCPCKHQPNIDRHSCILGNETQNESSEHINKIISTSVIAGSQQQTSFVKNQTTTTTSTNTSLSESSKKLSLDTSEGQSLNYGIALNCPCGSIHQPSTVDRETQDKTQSESSKQFSQPSTNDKEKLDSLKADLAQHLIKQKVTTSQKQSPRFEKASQCACQYKPSKTNRETVRPDQSVPYKNTMNCGCGIERQPSPTSSSTIEIDCRCVHMSLPKTIGTGTDVADKAQSEVTKHPLIQKINGLQGSPRGISSNCDCWVNIQPTTPDKETLHKTGSLDKERGGSFKYTSNKQVNSPQGELPTYGIALNCPCETKQRPTDRETLHSNRIDFADISRTEITKHVPKQQEIGFQKFSHTQSHTSQKQPHTSQKQFSALGITSDCACGRYQPIATDNKCLYAHESGLAEHPPSLLLESSQTHKKSVQKQAPGLGIASDCACQAYQPIAIDKKSLYSNKSGVVYNPASHPIKSSQIHTTTAQKKALASGIASDCACQTYQPIATVKKSLHSHISGIAEHSSSHPIKSSQIHTQTTQKQASALGIASDCACQTYQPIATVKKSLHRHKASIAEHPPSYPIKSLQTLTKTTEKPASALGIASDCVCQTYQPITTDNKSLHSHISGVAEHPSSHPITSSQIHTQSTQKQASALGIASDCACQIYQPFAPIKKRLHSHKASIAEHPRSYPKKISQTHTQGAQKQASALGIASDCACQTYQSIANDKKSLNSHNSGIAGDPPSHPIKYLQNQTSGHYQSSSDKTGLAEHSKRRKSSQTLTHTSHQTCRKTNLAKHPPNRQIKCSQTPSQTTQKRSSVRIISEKLSSTTHKKNKPCKYSSNQQVKSSRKLSPTLKKSSHYQPWTIGTKYHHHHPQNSDLIENSSGQRINTTQKRSFGKSKCGCSKNIHECTCSLPYSSKSVIVDKPPSKLFQRKSAFSKPSKHPTPRTGSTHKECTTANKLRVPSVRTPSCKRKTVLADKSRSRLLRLTKNQQAAISKHQHLIIPSDCCCSHEDVQFSDEISRFSLKTDKYGYQNPKFTVKRSSIRSFITSDPCAGSVNQPSSSQLPLSKISRQSSKICRLVMKLHSKLFSRKRSKQTKIPQHSTIPTNSCLSNSPCSVKNITSSHFKFIQPGKHHQSLSGRSIRQQTSKRSSQHSSFPLYSNHTSCRCPDKKASSSWHNPEKSSSLNSRKSILVDKSRLSLRRHGQMSKVIRHPSFQIYSKPSTSHSRCRYPPVQKISSELSRDKKRYIRKPIIVDKSHSCLSKPSISKQSKTSQRLSFPSYSNDIECRGQVYNTSSSKLFHSKISRHTCKPMVDKLYSGLSGRNVSQQSKTSHSSIIMSMLPVECICSSDEASMAQNYETSGHSLKIALGRKSHSIKQHPPSQRHKTSQFSPFLNQSASKHSIQTPLNNFQPSFSKKQENSDVLNTSQHAKRTQYPSSSDNYEPTSKITAEKQRLRSDLISQLPRETTGIERQPESPKYNSSQQAEISKYSRHFSFQPRPSAYKQQLISDPGSHLIHKTTTEGTEGEPRFPHHISSQPHDISRKSFFRRSQSKQLTEKVGNLSDVISQQPHTNKLGNEVQSGSTQDLLGQEIQMSKRSSFFHRSKSKPLTEKLRLISNKISQTSAKYGQDKLSDTQKFQTPQIIPGKCTCLSEKLHQLSERISQYSHKSVLAKKSLSGLSINLHSAQPLAERQRLPSNQVSHLPRKTILETEGQYAFPEHHLSQHPEFSKYSGYSRAQLTPSAEKRRLPSDPVSHFLRKTTLGTDGPAEVYHHVPSQLPEISKYSPHFPTPTGEIQRFPSDLVSKLPRKTMPGTEEQHGFPQHHPNQQPEMSKYSRHFGAQPIPAIDKDWLPSDPEPHLARNTMVGTEEPAGASQHLPSQQPELSKYSHQSGALPSPSPEKQRLPSDPVSHFLRKTTIGTEGSANVSHHLLGQQPEISKYSRIISSQPIQSGERQRLPSDSASHLPCKGTLVTEEQPEFPQHHPTREPDSKYSRYSSAQLTPLAEKPQLPSYPEPPLPLSSTTRTEESAEVSHHRPTTEISKYSRHLSSRPKRLTENQRNLSDIKSQQPLITAHDKIPMQKLPQHYPSQQLEKSERPHPLDPFQPTIPIIPGMCRCAEKQRRQTEYSRNTASDSKSQLNIDLQHYSSDHPEIPERVPRLQGTLQLTPPSEKQRLLSGPESYCPRKTTLGTEDPPTFLKHLPSQQSKITKYLPHSINHTATTDEKKSKLPPDSVWHFPSKIRHESDDLARFSQHHTSQQTEISKKEQYVSSQLIPSSAKKRLSSDPVSHPNNTSIENGQPDPLQYLSSQRTDISKRLSPFHRSQPKRLTKKLRNISDIITQEPPKAERENISQQKQSQPYPSQQYELSKHPYPLDHSQSIPIVPGKCTCTDEQRFQAEYSRINTIDNKSQQKNIDLQYLPSHQPKISEHSPRINSFQPTSSAEKQRLLSNLVSQHPHKTSIGTNTQARFPQHLTSQSPEISKYSRHFNSHSTPSVEKQSLPSHPVSHIPRKTTTGTERQHGYSQHHTSQKPEISKYSRHSSAQPMPVDEKQRLLSVPVSHRLRNTAIGTERRPGFFQPVSSRQPVISPSPSPLHNFLPIRVIPGECTCSVNKRRIPPQVVPDNLQKPASESTLQPVHSPKMSECRPASQHFQQLHIISGACTGSTKKTWLSHDNVSDYSYKIGQTEKRVPQHVTIQRSKIEQCPLSSLSSKIMSFVYPSACDCSIMQPKIGSDKISHVSTKTSPAPVDKPPPGLLQQHSSGQVRKGSADSGVQQQQLPQHALPKQSPYPDFNHVSMRYPGYISAPKRPGIIPGPIRSEHIPYPANYYYPPAVGVSPPPNYARYPCYANPANKCGPKSCHDEFALRRAYKRRPLRFIPPKQQMKLPKPQNKNKTVVVEPKKKGLGRKFRQCSQCVRDLINESDKKAWPTDVTCRPMYIHTMRRKPCFWIFGCCPSMYPAFLNCLKFQENICQTFMYILSICFWCPLIFCVYFCCDLICRSG